MQNLSARPPVLRQLGGLPRHCRAQDELHRVQDQVRDGIFKLLMSPGIDSTKSIPPAYVAWRAGTTTLVLLGS